MIGNIIWFVFAGLWLAIGYAIAAFFCFILIITIPFGVAVAAHRHVHALAVRASRSAEGQQGRGSAIGNVIWFVIAGWWLTLVHILSGILLCLTIIGIPLGLANFKLITWACAHSVARSCRLRKRRAEPAGQPMRRSRARVLS